MIVTLPNAFRHSICLSQTNAEFKNFVVRALVIDQLAEQ